MSAQVRPLCVDGMWQLCIPRPPLCGYLTKCMVPHALLHAMQWAPVQKYLVNLANLETHLAHSLPTTCPQSPCIPTLAGCFAHEEHKLATLGAAAAEALLETCASDLHMLGF